MRYIQKDYSHPVVTQHDKELADAELNEVSLERRKQTEELHGDELYRQIRSTECIPHWRDLQKRLNEEQGGVCCYCGQKLCFPDTQHYSVEHVKPRSKYPCLVGEYKNLLLSCHSSEKERADVKEIVRRKKDRKKQFHCDEYKGNNELHYSPLQLDCASHFLYKLNGEVEGDDDNAKKDIETLNINCKPLVDRRLNLLSCLYVDENGNELLDDESLKSFRDGIIKRNDRGEFTEFYFVIASVIDQLLPTR